LFLCFASLLLILDQLLVFSVSNISNFIEEVKIDHFVMSTATSTSTEASPKAGGSQHARQGSQGPRVNNGNTGSAKKTSNGGQKSEYKSDAGRKSPQGAVNGQQGKKTQHVKVKSSTSMSDYLRQRGATVEVASSVSQIRSDLGGYYSEELVFNTFVANGNNAEATRAALTQSKATSWASKVSPSAAMASSSKPDVNGAVPAPAHIAQQQQAPRPRKVKPAQETKPVVTPATVVVAEIAVDPEQMEKSLESALQATQSQAQELLGLQSTVGRVRSAQAELSGEKEQLLHNIAQREAETAKDRARIQLIDATLGEHKNTLADLQKTIAQKTK
jgi:hypothetical protein